MWLASLYLCPARIINHVQSIPVGKVQMLNLYGESIKAANYRVLVVAFMPSCSEPESGSQGQSSFLAGAVVIIAIIFFVS